MTSDALAVVQSLFTNIWTIFNSWYIPGTHVTPAALLFFGLFVALVIRFIRRLLMGEGGNSNV